jgi:uncharacterized membrane protein YhaH (DUF805 family)
MAKIKSKSTKVSNSDNNVGLFSGRLNRSGFILGILAVIFFWVIIGMIFLPLLAKISGTAASNRGIIIFTALVILSSTFYSFSFSLRRLHDLNRSGFWLLFYTPGVLISLLAVVQGLSSAFFGPSSQISQALFSFSDAQGSLLIILGSINALSSFFAVYVIAWPSYKKANKWGPPSTHWKLKEILGFNK